MPTIRAWATPSATSPLAPFEISRREPGERDVVIDIAFCGICHSDLHQARDEWGGALFPMVPGHEIVGRVARVGKAVTKLRAGDVAGVGCMVDSCRTCPDCMEGLEQYCRNEIIFTYNSNDRHTGGMTYGGYSGAIVVDERFVLRVPTNLDLPAVAPLLCAGITTYSPLRHWKVGKGDTVGVVGLGGLGHMAVKLANAFGATVVMFTTSPGKADDAKRLGAHEVVISKNTGEVRKQANRFDFILNTVAAPHNLDAFLTLLRRDGTMCMVGAPAQPHPSPNVSNLIFSRRKLAGSLIGGIRETQEMLDFCGERGIVSDIEQIPIQKINEAYERMLRSDVRYRFVIDMASLPKFGEVPNG